MESINQNALNSLSLYELNELMYFYKYLTADLYPSIRHNNINQSIRKEHENLIYNAIKQRLCLFDIKLFGSSIFKDNQSYNRDVKSTINLDVLALLSLYDLNELKKFYESLTEEVFSIRHDNVDQKLRAERKDLISDAIKQRLFSVDSQLFEQSIVHNDDGKSQKSLTNS